MKKLPLAFVSLSILCATAIHAQVPADAWQIGPIIKGRNSSVNMPLRPTATRNGWRFDFPHTTRADGHVHYVTFDPGDLVGARSIVVRYRVTSAPGVRFVPQEQQELPGTVSVFFQRRGDRWTGRGKYALYRWYAPDRTVDRLAPGTHEMVVSLDDPDWVSVVGNSKPDEVPDAFRAALEDTSQIGLVFGSSDRRGHGVFATGPARFELLRFDIR